MENIMQVNKKEYSIIKLLGKGKGGYSYLASDGEQKYVLKQIHHEPCSYYQFGNKIEAEINDYKRLKTIGIRIPEMIDADIANERIWKMWKSIHSMFLRQIIAGSQHFHNGGYFGFPIYPVKGNLKRQGG